MIMNKLKKWKSKELNWYVYFILGALLGIILFIALYGVKVLDFTYTDWVMSSGDLTQHYIGWEYFRDSKWTFPIGMSSNYGYPIGVAITYTDSIPILALFFKLIRGILPTRFQYFGLWGILCFALQGGIAAVILKKYIKNLVIVLLSTIFIIICPPMIRKMFNHTALAAHWIILLSLAVWVYRHKFKSTKSKIITWTSINVLGVLIHPYFIPMTMIVMLGFFIDELIYGKKIKDAIFTFISSIISIVIVFWSIGGFTGESAEAKGLGEFSMNINSLFNPMGWSSFLKDLQVANIGQYEGFQYLGLGMIILLILSIVILIFKLIFNGNIFGKRKINKELFIYKIKRIISPLIVFIILLVISLSNIITFNDNIIYEYKLPDFIESIFNIFRSTGRLFWPITYIIIFSILIIIFKNIKSFKVVFIILVSTLFIQVADLSNKFEEISNKFKTNITFNTTIKSDFWNGVGENFEHIMILPAYISDYSYFSRLATDYNMTLNTGSYARGPYDEIANIASQTVGELKEGKIDDNTVYIIQHFNVLVDVMINAPKDKYRVIKADKYFVLYSSNNSIDISKYEDITAYTSDDFINTSLEDYLENLLSINKNIAIMISKKGDISYIPNNEIDERFKNLGLRINLSEANTKSFVAVLLPNDKENSIELIDDKNLSISLNKDDILSNSKLENKIDITADKVDSVYYSKLLINNVQYSMSRDGLNILVYDIDENEVINISNFELKDNLIGRVMNFK